MTQHDLTLRPITGPGEIDLFNSFPYVLNREVAGDLEVGRRHPQWLWLALRDGRPVARAGWWSRPGDEHPLVMDFLDLADGHAGDAARLLDAALAAIVAPGGTPPEFCRFLEPDWRDRDDTRAAVEARTSLLQRTGAELLVERLRLEWRPGTPIPEPTGRLRFRPVAGAGELTDLMARVLTGTLDAHSRTELTRMTPRESAEEQYRDEMERYSTPRDWWQVATLPDGEPVGFVIPAHNGYHPVIAYLAVVPEHRGRGYIDEILAEGTRILAGRDVPRIRAATDVGNVPMAAAFARAGYVTFQRQIDLTWS